MIIYDNMHMYILHVYLIWPWYTLKVHDRPTIDLSTHAEAYPMALDRNL